MRSVLFAPVGLALLLAVPACASHSTSVPAAAADQGAPPAAPRSVSCGSFAAKSAGPTARATLFSQLTATSWAYPSYGGSTNLSVTLYPTGSYSIVHPPQYSPTGGQTSSSVESGKWNFAAIGSQTGVVCLDGNGAPASHDGGAENLPSVLHFSFPVNGQGSNITLGPYNLPAGDALAPSALASADTLPNVAVSPGFAALVGAEWKKTNAFDATLTPGAIAFDKSGGYTIGAGACPVDGFISFDRDTLVPGRDYSTFGGGGGPSPCDGLYPVGLQSPVVPGFFGDLLVLGQGTYRRADASNGKPNAFVFDPYGHSVRVYGTYDGAFKAGAATTIALTFENTDVTLTRTLGTFNATLQPATVQPYGQAQTAGKLVPVGTVDLGGVTLAPGEKHYATLVVTPPAAGDTFAFAMRVTFTDSLKKYDGGHTYITAIAP